MKAVLVLCALAVIVNCAPQEIGDAEFVPELAGSTGTKEKDGDSESTVPVFILFRRPSLFDFFGDFFNRPIFRFPSFFDDRSNGTGFDIDSLFPPVNPEELPDNYKNSTSEVRDVDGQQMLVNRTVTKTTDEDGISFTSVQVSTSLLRDNETEAVGGEGGATGEDAPVEDPSVNKTPSDRRPRRSIDTFVTHVLFDLMERYHVNDLIHGRSKKVKTTDKELEAFKTQELSYEGDTAVNLLSENLDREPDADVFVDI